MKVLAALRHPNIIEYKSCYSRPDQSLCIVMEYAAGGDVSISW